MLVYTDGSRRACSTANCSEGVSENVDWVLRPNTTYTRADGTAVIGTLDNWTTYGEDDTCTNWTNGDGANPPRGSAGALTVTDSSAISFNLNCNFVTKLICVVQ